MNQLYNELIKKPNAIHAIDTSDLVKKKFTTIQKIPNKILDSDKNISTPKFNKSTRQNFAGRLKQVNWAKENHLADIVKKTDSDEKLRISNNKVTSDKAEHVEAKKKLNYYVISSIKVINDLSGEVKWPSAKGLTKDSINKHNIIINCIKYFVGIVSQNYLAFQHPNQSLNIFMCLVILIDLLINVCMEI